MRQPGFGQRLRQLRQAKSWTPEELAKRAGVHPQTVRKIEDGQRNNPRFDIAARLAKALGVSLDSFVVATKSRGTVPPRPAKRAERAARRIRAIWLRELGVPPEEARHYCEGPAYPAQLEDEMENLLAVRELARLTPSYAELRSLVHLPPASLPRQDLPERG